MSAKKGALGKGLDALISLDQDFDILNEKPVMTSENRGAVDISDRILTVPIEHIQRNPEQPRTHFNEESLHELADSISQQGIIQPILVEKKAELQYMIIAGERRFRAAGIAGLKTIPVIVREFTLEEKLEIALIENIQRENLTAIEEALAYKNMMDTLNITQQVVAEKVGKNRSTVANSLRLLNLPEIMQQAVSEKKISAGHARALLSLEKSSDQKLLFNQIINKGYSVRDAEKAASDINQGKIKPPGKKDISNSKDPDVMHIEQGLLEKLGTKVQLKGNLKKGRIEITYFSSDDLDRIFSLITK